MEQTLLNAGLVQSDNLETAIKAGKVLNVNYIVVGQVEKEGLKIKTKIHLINVSQGCIQKTWSPVFNGRDDILNKIPEFAKKIVQTINLAVPIEIKKEQRKTYISHLKAEVDKDKRSILLTWDFDPSDPITRFNVYRSENRDGPYQLIGSTNKNLFEDTKLNDGSKYYYLVSSVLYSGEEVKHRPIVEVMNINEELPYPPIILETQGLIKRVKLKFAPSLLNEKKGYKIDKYILYKQEDGFKREVIKEINSKDINTQLDFSYFVEVDNLEDGKNYKFCLTSVTDQGEESPCSDFVSIRTISPPTLYIIKDNLLREIDLGWYKIEKIKGYKLYRRLPGEDWEKIVNIYDEDKTQYLDKKDLKDGLTYEYYLTAYDSEEETGHSNVVRAKTKDLPPPPSNIRAQSGMVKSVLITWTPVNDEDIGGYIIYRGLDVKDMYEIAKVKGFTRSSYLDKGSLTEPLEDGHTYYYAISSFNLFNAEGEISEAVKATTKSRPKPVKDFEGGIEDNKIVLRWSKNKEPDIRAYILYRSSNKRSWSELIQLPSNQIQYEDYDIKPDVVYSYKIIAVDKDNLQSDPRMVLDISFSN